MSKIDGIKEQYPHLDISILDVLKKFDISGTNKYLPLFCKIFKKKFDYQTMVYENRSSEDVLLESYEELNDIGFEPNSFSANEIFMVFHLLEIFRKHELKTFKKFMELSEKKLIDNKDITSFKDYDEIENAVSLAEIKNLNKELAKSVITEHEDDNWLIIRPLTHEASKKYGATTRWCTSSEKDIETFKRYWRDGILVYFINKKTGIKVGGFKSLKEKEGYTFWTAADDRVDFLCSELDEYLIPIVKKIFSSTLSNSDLCTTDLKMEVHEESHRIKYIRRLSLGLPEDATSVSDRDIVQMENYSDYFEKYNYNVPIDNLVSGTNDTTVIRIDYNTDIA